MSVLNDPPIGPPSGDDTPHYRSLVREWRVSMVRWLRNSMWESIYPVGAVYTSTDNTTTPDDLFGGTWAVVSAVSPYTWERTA